MKTAFVWNIPTRTEPLPYGAYIGTHLLASICEMDAVWWPVGENAPEKIKDYNCVIVSLFGDMRHVTQIKAMHPACYVIALPDSYFDDTFVNYSVWDMNMLTQMQAADCIGYISESNRQFYGGFFHDKPFVRMPMPIGHDEYFVSIRTQAKDDFIITCDHVEITGARRVDYTAQNVAAVAQIQRATGLRVVYVNTAPKTPEYAKIAGLDATFASYIDFETYARLAATARLGVDMYALHGYGRNALMYAYAGTPAVGSTYTDFYEFGCDPWMAEDAADLALNVLEDTREYKRIRTAGIERAYRDHSADACRKQLLTILEQVEAWRHLPQPN